MQQLQNHQHHQQHGGHSHHRAEYAQIAANATLPRNKKKKEAAISSHRVQETPYAVSQSLGKELSTSSSPSSTWLVLSPILMKLGDVAWVLQLHQVFG